MPRKKRYETFPTHVDPLKKERYLSWGDPAHRFDPKITKNFVDILTNELGLTESPKKQSPIAANKQRIPESQLPRSFVRHWAKKGLSIDSFDRLIHATGKSYRDLIRLWNGALTRYPDGVLFLQGEDDLKQLFVDAKKHSIVLIPFGGGTGVVGGTECLGPKKKPILIVDLKNLSRLVSFDEVSQTATFQAGILGPELERILNSKGYTLGHFPQSFEYSTLGGWVVTRSAGQNSTKYGKIEDMVVSLKIHTPKGLIETRTVPASATGPALKEVLIGSEGIYGIITEVTLKVWRKSQQRRFIAAFFKDFGEGIRCIRELMQKGLKPSVVRLSDARETELFRQMRHEPHWKEDVFSLFCRMTGLGSGRCFLLIAAEGTRAEVAYQTIQIHLCLRGCGGIPLAGSFEKRWEENRFELPYMRDDLLMYGFLIDTLETAAEWSRLEDLYRAMRTTFEKDKGSVKSPLIMGCHLSHAYSDGASLYFTFIGKQEKGREIKQWSRIKTLATNVIMREGGTLSHHHGIGYDHKRWMMQEKSLLGLEVLRQIKNELDPDNLLNPEKVF